MIGLESQGRHALAQGESREPLIEATARTDVGLRRQVNEDAVLAEYPVYVVADGMGGHEAGELASAAAVAAFAALPGIAHRLHITDVDRAIDAARAAVDTVAAGTERGAGCTLTGAVMVEHEGNPCWYVFNVGDSRVYQHSGTGLTQITDDHSLHAELAAAGSAEAADTPRNVITRALGSGDSRHDGWLLPAATGARLLICSDGLTTELDDEEIRAVLTIGGRSEAVADELVRRALEAGGRDNITVIVVDTVSSGSASTGPIVIAAAADDDDEEDTQETIEVTRPVRRRAG